MDWINSRIFHRRHVAFQAHCTLRELTNVPFLSGLYYAKWKLLGHAGGGSSSAASSGMTYHMPIKQNTVVFNTEFSFVVNIPVDKDGLLQDCGLWVSIRQELVGGARSGEKIGECHVNLSEFAPPAGAPPRGAAAQRRYLLSESKLNAILAVSVQLERIAASPGSGGAPGGVPELAYRVPASSGGHGDAPVGLGAETLLQSLEELHLAVRPDDVGGGRLADAAPLGDRGRFSAASGAALAGSTSSVPGTLLDAGSPASGDATDVSPVEIGGGEPPLLLQPVSPPLEAAPDSPTKPPWLTLPAVAGRRGSWATSGSPGTDLSPVAPSPSSGGTSTWGRATLGNTQLSDATAAVAGRLGGDGSTDAAPPRRRLLAHVLQQLRSGPASIGSGGSGGSSGSGNATAGLGSLPTITGGGRHTLPARKKPPARSVLQNAGSSGAAQTTEAAGSADLPRFRRDRPFELVVGPPEETAGTIQPRGSHEHSLATARARPTVGWPSRATLRRQERLFVPSTEADPAERQPPSENGLLEPPHVPRMPAEPLVRQLFEYAIYNVKLQDALAVGGGSAAAIPSPAVSPAAPAAERRGNPPAFDDGWSVSGRSSLSGSSPTPLSNSGSSSSAAGWPFGSASPASSRAATPVPLSDGALRELGARSASSPSSAASSSASLSFAGFRPHLGQSRLGGESVGSLDTA